MTFVYESGKWSPKFEDDFRQFIRQIITYDFPTWCLTRTDKKNEHKIQNIFCGQT